MGVPVITLAGACHAHNVGVSLLAAVGLDEDWVAHSEEEYVELAVRHAQDVQVCGGCITGMCVVILVCCGSMTNMSYVWNLLDTVLWVNEPRLAHNVGVSLQTAVGLKTALGGTK